MMPYCLTGACFFFFALAFLQNKNRSSGWVFFSLMASNTSPIFFNKACNKSIFYLQTLFNPYYKKKKKKSSIRQKWFCFRARQLRCLYQSKAVLGLWKVTTASCSTRQKSSNVTAVSVPCLEPQIICQQRLPTKPPNNSVKKFHGQHNLQQLRRSTEATALWWWISGRGWEKSCLQALLHWLRRSTSELQL